jgi:hypothetical protein
MSLDGPLLVIRLFGTLVGPDLDALVEELLAIEEGGRRTPPRLIDVRAVSEMAIGYADIARLAERSRSRPLAADIRSAVLVSQPVQLGYARMFQILNEHPRVTVHIFEDEQSAREWVVGAARDTSVRSTAPGDNQ